MKDIVNQHSFLKTEVMPKKDHERRSLKFLLWDLQAMYDPRIKFLDLPEGLHPRIADELWAELLAVEERVKIIQIKLSTLEHLHHVAEKIEKEKKDITNHFDEYLEQGSGFLKSPYPH